jgi:hypothetical protein
VPFYRWSVCLRQLIDFNKLLPTFEELLITKMVDFISCGVTVLPYPKTPTNVNFYSKLLALVDTHSWTTAELYDSTFCSYAVKHSTVHLDILT